MANNSLQNFAHVTTAQLSWHVQNVWLSAYYKLDENEIKIPLNLKYNWKIVSEMIPCSESSKLAVNDSVCWAAAAQTCNK